MVSPRQTPLPDKSLCENRWFNGRPAHGEPAPGISREDSNLRSGRRSQPALPPQLSGKSIVYLTPLRRCAVVEYTDLRCGKGAWKALRKRKS